MASAEVRAGQHQGLRLFNSVARCVIAALLLLLASVPGAVRAQAVCAVVKIEIQQKVSLERQAFTADLKITNGLTTVPINNLSVNVTATDAAGQPVAITSDPNATTDPQTHQPYLFFARPPSAPVTTVAPSTSGEMSWLLIPTVGAGGGSPAGAMYKIGATLSYQLGDGAVQTITIDPEIITVLPQPQLQLDYFLTYNVYGDDAFTQIVEPPVPFTLGLRVKNTGYGTARQLTVDSAQPKIVENQQGLLIDFKLLDSFTDEQPSQPTLFVNVGDLAAGVTRMVRWDMETTLSGTFTDFTASFTHDDALGGQLTSFIPPDGVRAHKLLHDVLVDLPGRDATRDFLALGGDNFDDSILRVYESDGTDTEITDVSANAHLSGNTLTVGSTTGFIFARVTTTAANGNASAISAVRADGKHMPAANVWTSKERTPDGTQWIYYINVFDPDGGAGSYTLSIANDAMPTLVLDIALGTTRVVAGDQFAVQIGDLAGMVLTDPLSSTTAGSGNQISPNSGSSGLVQLNPGSTYLLSVFGANGTNLGAYQTAISCSNGANNSPTLLPNAVGGSFPLTAVYGDVIHCTYTISAPPPNAGVLGVSLVESPADGSGRFDLSIVDGAGHVVVAQPNNANHAQVGPISVAQGTYSVIEAPSPGTNASDYLTSYQCSNLSTATLITSGSGLVVSGLSVGAGQQVACTFTNTRQTDAPAFKLVATANGGDGAFDFTVLGDATPSTPHIATSGGAGAVALSNLVIGHTLDVTETVPSGWTLTSKSCSNLNPAHPGVVTMPVTLAAGDDITCTFANSHSNMPATVTVQEITAQGTGSFVFLGTNGINGGASFMLTTTNAQPVSSTAYSVSTNGTSATLTQTAPSGFALTGAYCVDASNAFVAGVTLSGSTLTIPGAALSSGAALTCAFQNAPVSMAVVKTAGAPQPTGTTNQYQITYTVAVTNTGTTAGTYALDDALSFAGATIDSVSTVTQSGAGTGGTLSTTFNGQNSTLGIVSGRSLAAGQSDSYAYSVTYTVTNAATAGDCSVATNGLRNVALLNGTAQPGGVGATCSSSALSVTTQANAPVSTGVAKQYHVRYLTTVTNAALSSGAYTLNAALNLPGATVDAVSAVTVGGTGTQPPVVGTLNATGGTLVSNAGLASGATQTYTYDVTFTVTDAAALNANVTGCALGTNGAQNTTSLVAGDGTSVVSTCSEVPDVSVAVAVTSLSKSLSRQSLVYTVTYQITVANHGPAATYDLSTALTFNGVALQGVSDDGESANVTTPVDGFATLSGTTATGPIVTAEPIAAGQATETFTYEVSYQVVDDTQFDCAAGGGFVTTTTVNGSPSTTCFNPAGALLTAGVDDAANFTVTVRDENGQIVNTIDPNTAGMDLIDLAPGTYTVTESVLPGSTLDTSNAAYICSEAVFNQIHVVASGSGPSVTLTLADGEQVGCGFNNTPQPKTANFKVVASTTGGDGTFAFSVSGGPSLPSPNIATNNGSGSATLNNVLVGQTVNVTETVPSGWTLTGTICSNANPAAPGSVSLPVTLADGDDVTCTFSNTLQPKLALVATASGGDNTFAFAVSGGATPAAPSITTVNGTGNLALGSLAVGQTINISETVPSGWSLSSNVCNNVNPAHAGAVTLPLTLAAGDDITCTFANTFVPPTPPKFALAVDTSGGDGTFAFAVTGGATPAAPSITTSGGTGNVALGNLIIGQTLGVTETVPSGWILTGSNCSNANPAHPGTVSLPVTLASADDITCTFANSHPNVPATVTVQETAQGSGSFVFLGTNGINGGTSFTLTTTNAQPVSSTAYSVSTNGTTTTLTQTAPAGFALTGAYCVDASNAFVAGVTLNGHQLTIPGAALSSGAVLTCAFQNAPVSLAVVKTASTPKPTGTTNQYQIAYTVAVTNTGTTTGTYALDDALSFAGATIDSVSTVTQSGAGTGGTLSTTFTGQNSTLGIVSGRSLGAGQSDSYAYNVTYTVTNAATAGDCSVATNGLRNVALLNGTAQPGGVGATCNGGSALSVTTQANAPVSTGVAKQYHVRYLTTVTNAALSSGAYTLNTALNLPGATVDAVSAVAVGGTGTQPPIVGTLTATGGTLVSNAGLASGATQSYTYDVTFTVTDAAALNANVTGCALGTNGAQNTTSLVAGDGTSVVSTCSEVPDVRVLVALTQLPSQVQSVHIDNTVVYQVTVVNFGAASSYSVNDALTDSYPIDNAALDDTSTNVTTALSDFVVAPDQGSAQASFVTGEPIAAGRQNAPTFETFTYEVSYNDQLDTGTDCSTSGGLRTSVSLDNGATATHCYDASADAYLTGLVDDASRYSLTLRDSSNAVVATFDPYTQQLDPTPLSSAQSYTLTETALDGSTLDPNQVSYVCSSPGRFKPIIVASGMGTSATFTPPGSQITCQFTNGAAAPKLRIAVMANGGNATFNFSVTGATPTAPSITTSSGTGSLALSNVNPGQPINITETVPSGWSLASTVCHNATTNGSANLQFGLSAGDDVTCTYTNNLTPKFKLVVNATGGNGTFGFTVSGGATPTSPSITTSGGTGNATLASLVVGQSINVSENVPSGWSLTGTTCNNANPAHSGTVTLPVTVGVADDITCTFANTAGAPKFKLVANASGGNGTFGYTVSGGATPAAPSITTSGGTGNVALASLAIGQTINVTESTIPSGWTLSGTSCTNANPAHPGAVSLPATLAGGDDITCTFANTLVPKFKLAVTSSPINGTFTFGVTGGATPASPSITTSSGAGNLALASLAVGQSINVTETLPDGWTLNSASCSNANPAHPGAVSLPVTLAAGDDITCTYAHSVIQTFTIQVNASGANGTFPFTVGGGPTPTSANITTTNGAGSLNLGNVAAGQTVNVTESVPSGWTLSNVRCVRLNNFTNQLTTVFLPITSQSGDSITCTYANSSFATIKVQESTSNGTGTFSFSGTNGINGGSAFTLNTATANPATSTAYSVAANGTATTITQTPPAGFGLTGAYCTNASNALISGVTLSGNALTVPASAVTAGAALTCRFNNAKPSINVVKTAGAPVAQTPANQYKITYSVLVTNTGALAGTYNLNDVLTFNGTTINAVTAPTQSGTGSGGTLSGTFNGQGVNTAIVTGRSLGVGAADTYSYTVTYTVSDTTKSGDCSTPVKGLRSIALLNGTTMSGGGGVTCTVATSSVFATTMVNAPVSTGTANQYRATYLTTVTNSAASSASYTLADAVSYPGATVNAIGAVNVGGTDTLPPTAGTLTTSGGTIVSNAAIAAGKTHTFQYDVTFTVTNAATLNTSTTGCPTGMSGAQNAFTLTSGGATSLLATCVQVPDVHVAVAVTGNSTLSSVSYQVTVTNAGAATNYDLGQTLTYNGATISSVSAATVSNNVTTPRAAWTINGSSATTTLVSAEPVAAGSTAAPATEVFQYSVNYSVTNSNLLTCPSGGLQNAAGAAGATSTSCFSPNAAHITGEASTDPVDFTVTLRQGQTVIASTDPNTLQVGPTEVTALTAYTLTMSASGTTFNTTNTSWGCSMQKSSGGSVTLSNGVGPVISVTPTAGQQVNCSFSYSGPVGQ